MFAFFNEEFLNRFLNDEEVSSTLHILITLIHRVKTNGINKVQLTNYLKEFIKFQNLLEKEFYNSKKVNFYSEKLGFSSKKLNSIVNYVANKSAKSFIDDVIIIKAKNICYTLAYQLKK